MLRRINHLPFLVLAAMLALSLGCSQPEDVVTSITSTTLTLSVERLPTTPDGMIYELWVAGTSDTISLGKFFWDNRNARFATPGTGGTWMTRSNVFLFEDDILKYMVTNGNKSLKYKSLFISVETYPTDAAPHGPIMLIDDITDPGIDPLDLVFPESDTMWLSTVRMNMETVSDRDGNVGDGSGIWFSIYRDTIHEYLDSIDLDTSSTMVEIPPAAQKPESLYVCNLRNIRVETTLVAFGPDTLYYSSDTLKKVAVRYDFDLCVPAPPYQRPDYDFVYQTTPVLAELHIFTQDNFALPDFTPWGWKYKGWVVSNAIPKTAVGPFSPPAWVYKGVSFNYIPGDDGGLMSTGTFSHIDLPDDDGNPFGFPKPASSMYPVTPPYPGGDFINSAAMSARFGISSIDFIGAPGTAFISLEPINNPDTTTNFPLIVMLRSLPTDRSVISDTNTVSLNMFNKSSHLRGDLQGLPIVSVGIDRF
ncbi:MAG: hypothetical protein AB1644_01555 [Candidatus Zixiibacteriota bacterium]